MKKLFTMLALGMFMTGGAYAQNATKSERKELKARTEVRKVHKQARAQKATPEERAARQAEILSKKLDLSNEQKNQLQALNMKRTQELKALNDKYDTSDARRDAQRAERKAIQEKWHTEMKNVLNEKQYAAFEADRLERRETIRKSGNESVRVQKRIKEVKQDQSK